MISNFYLGILFYVQITIKDVSGANSNSNGGDCRDVQGRTYEHGMHYVPGPDLCKLCICENGQSKSCKTVLCNQPNCKSFQVGNSCCDFICLDDTLGTNERNSDFVNRLRQKKSRVRENRQVNEDQRSLGSIGYIGGNISYMGNGNMTLEYPYETNQGHYPLWKPPSSYFPRGEAPPPYEEAIALAQSEAAINTCTVSVATTTHRTLPMNVCNNPEDGITTNTTNLINININNAGTITSVAAGENHQITNGNVGTNTQPRSTQTTNAGQVTASSDNGRNTTVSVCAYTNQSNLTEAPNHPLTPSRLSMCNNSRCQIPKEVQTVALNQHQKALEPADYSNNATTILPPPLFDSNGNSNISNGNNCILNRHNISTPSSSRRYHRTIPRHFQSVDPIMSSLKTNEQSKKPTCQCPIQHVPMSYMGSTHFSQQTHTSSNTTSNSSSNNGIFLSKLSTNNKQGSNNINQASKSSKYAAVEANHINNNSNSNTLRRVKHMQNNQTSNQINSSAALTIASGLNHPSSVSHHQKIPTISKQIVTPNPLDLSTSTNNSSTSSSNPSSASSAASNHIHSILKNKSTNLLTSSTTSLKLLDTPSPGGTNSIKSTDILNPPFPIPFIDSKTTNDSATMMDSNHPVLPPKMYKNNNNSNKQNAYTTNNSNHNNNNNSNTQKIHTISKSQNQQGPGHHQQYPMITQQMRSNSMRMSFPNHNQTATNGPNTNFNTKSLRRNSNNSHNNNNSSHNNSHHNVDNSNILLLKNSEKSQSLVKINASIGFPANHITYSLPKPVNTTGKLSLRTSITDVVSKVPSVITIPSPSATASSVTLPPANSVVTTPTTIAATALTKSVSALSSGGTRNPYNLTLPTGNAVVAINALNNNSHHIHTTIHNNHSINNNNTIISPVVTSPKPDEKPLPVCTTSKNCSNPKEHFLPNDTSLDDDYLSECENCKSAHGSRYYLDEEIIDSPQETMTLQRKPTETEEEHDYYRTSQTLPTNTKQKTTTIKNREPWFQTIPASSSSDEEINE